MAREDAIRVEGQIISVLQEHLFQVALPNGHRMVGFVKGSQREILAGLGAGDMVTMEVSPCDLSKGMITASESRKQKL